MVLEDELHIIFENVGLHLESSDEVEAVSRPIVENFIVTP
jgi:hypothetical protein